MILYDPVERSNFQPNVNSQKMGHWTISVVVGISGRTFEFPVERSKSGQTLIVKKKVIGEFRLQPPSSAQARASARTK